VIDPKTGKAKLITKSTFEVQVADTIERISDKQVAIQSQDDLINMFGLRDVGAGSWSNKKKDELQWHMQKCGEAMVDLGDIIGIDPKLLGFDGRLMLTFGVGDRKNVRAHYASSTKTINMSKMKGGGSFGHEWWHAIDNILVSILNKKEMNTRDFLSSTPQLAGNNDRLVDAFRFLNVVLTQTSNSHPLAVKILDAHVKEAINAFENPDANNPYAKTVIGFGNQEDALTYLGEQEKEATGYQSLLQIQTWKQYVVLYYNQDKIGQTVTLPIGYGMSQFRANAIKLDGGKVKYWASVHELAARAFAHYLDKKLTDKGQKSGYLTYATTGDAFPSGNESERIIKAFDNIFNIIREEKILESAIADKALMDSIFGESQTDKTNEIANIKKHIAILPILENSKFFKAVAEIRVAMLALNQSAANPYAFKANQANFKAMVNSDELRVGGKTIDIDNPDELANIFGLRDVTNSESDKLKDENYKAHLKKTAEAFSDLSDVVGIDPKYLGFGGRLSMYFSKPQRIVANASYKPLSKTITLNGHKEEEGNAWGHE
jgi:hypothetical protein